MTVLTDTAGNDYRDSLTNWLETLAADEPVSLRKASGYQWLDKRVNIQFGADFSDDSRETLLLQVEAVLPHDDLPSDIPDEYTLSEAGGQLEAVADEFREVTAGVFSIETSDIGDFVYAGHSNAFDTHVFETRVDVGTSLY